MPSSSADGKRPNRWLIALAGTALQVCLGTAYAWSYFQNPLRDAFGWSNSLTAWAFCLTICALGLAAAAGGVLMPRVGPTRLAMGGGLLFGLGYLLGAVALQRQSPALLFLTYGLIGGSGLGLGYVTPVATVAKWFPDRKGLATSLVVMGFGLGALAMSKVFAPLLMEAFSRGVVLERETVTVLENGREVARQVLRDPEALQGVLARVFVALGAIFTVLTVPLGLCLRNPPAGWMAPAAGQGPAAGAPPAEDGVTTRQCVLSRRFLALWLVFFCNITAGIAIIGFQSPLFQDLWRRFDASLDGKALASYGATLIAVTALFNGVGRFLWGGLSDRIGRARTFSIMLGSQVLVFVALGWTGNPWVFAGLLCYILLCYGGGFGTMPSFVLDVFGARRMAAVYGTILTAWSAGGVVGPQLVALIKDRAGAAAGRYAFWVSAALVAAGFLISLRARDDAFAPKGG